jgi:alkanesulfonate monooxygenase SsuD/methylene tetrahydromethanopterin reductase-like flavin-dependent oxidoreductase (luciferase family)
MGLKPVTLADLEEYIRVVEGLVAGDTVEWDFEDKRRKIRFLNPEIGVVNIDDPIPLYISAMGPRGRALTARLGANWMEVAGHQGAAVAAVEQMRAAWREAGVDPATRVAAALASGCVLDDNEPADSARARAQAGPHAVVFFHNLAEADDLGLPAGAPPRALAPLLDRYRQIYSAYEPADARYLENHRGHLYFLRAEEHEVCTADLIRTLTYTGTKDELCDRLRELRDAGLDHFAIRIAHGHPDMLEEWADLFAKV